MIRKSNYTVVIQLPEKEYLLFHGYSGAVDIVGEYIVEALNLLENTSALTNALPIETTQKLLQRGYLTEKSPKEEEAFVEKMVHAMHKARKKLSGFEIVPSYACNLACPYCYQTMLREKDNKGMVRIMTRELADQAFTAMHQLIEKYGETDQQRAILFYGGEPFLARNHDIVSYIIEKGKKLGFTFSAVTNGTQVAKFIPIFDSPELFQLFQITLDGVPEIHNKRRRYVNGQGSFEHIAENISLLLANGYTISLRINIDYENLHHIERLFNLFGEKGWLKYSNFNPYYAVVHQAGGHRSIKEPQFSQTITEAIAKKYPYITDSEKVYKLFRRIFEVGGRVPFGTTYCGANSGQFLFDPYGELHACWSHPGCEVDMIGRYSPQLMFFEDKLSLWGDRVVSSITECRACKYAFLCKGGCSKHAYDITGSIYTPFCDDFPQHFEYHVKRAYKSFRIQQAKDTSIAQMSLATPMILSNQRAGGGRCDAG